MSVNSESMLNSSIVSYASH